MDGSEQLATFQAIVPLVDRLGPDLAVRADADLRALSGSLQGRARAGEDLDQLLVEAFALVREAADRSIGQRHDGAQLVAGAALHAGTFVRLAAAEGKTLAATLPAYLGALTGQGVHVVTANGYLARRDYERMGPVYRFLGLDVGLVAGNDEPAERADQQGYAVAVTYGDGARLATDYLRDNLVGKPDQVRQRGQRFAIVDDVDAVLWRHGRLWAVLRPRAATDADELVARITVGGYLRLYEKLAGMSGAGGRWWQQLASEHGRAVVAVPPRQPIVCTERSSLHATRRSKLDHLDRTLAAAHGADRPVLVATPSPAEAGSVADLLARRGIDHTRLDMTEPTTDMAQAERALAEAGRPGAVTLLVGDLCGLDLVLGGTAGRDGPKVDDQRDQVVAAGGLLEIQLGEEQWMSEWLRRWAGRRGEPGEILLLWSIDVAPGPFRVIEHIVDHVWGLMSRLGSRRPIPPLLQTAGRGIDDIVERSRARHAKRYRQPLLDFDAIADDQRERVYRSRRCILASTPEQLHQHCRDQLRDAVHDLVARHCPAEAAGAEWDLDGLFAAVAKLHRPQLRPDDVAADPDQGALAERLVVELHRAYEERRTELDAELAAALEHGVVLRVLDREWCRQLAQLTLIERRLVAGLPSRSQALVDARRQAARRFDQMQGRCSYDTARYLFHAQVSRRG